MFKPILDSDQGQALLRRAKAAGAAKRSKSSTTEKPIKDTLNYKGTTPQRYDNRVEKKKKTDDIKINKNKRTGGGGKQTHHRGGNNNTSGPGDANL